MKRIDWNYIQSIYDSKRITLKQLAKQSGISRQAISKAAIEKRFLPRRRIRAIRELMLFSLQGTKYDYPSDYTVFI